MTRSRSSAKAAGSRFERSIADWLAANVDDRIDRRVKSGSKDRGDIGGVRLSPALGGGRVVIECKDVAKLSLGTWYSEAVTEMGNDDAVVAAVVHKRVGKGNPSDQWVTLTLGDLRALLIGERVES